MGIAFIDLIIAKAVCDVAIDFYITYLLML